MKEADINVWRMLLEQIPPLIRTIISVLAVGVSTLIGVLWRWQRRDIERLENRIDRLEQHIDQRFEETNNHLLNVATSKTGGNDG